jgi:hypothetical protein
MTKLQKLKKLVTQNPTILDYMAAEHNEITDEDFDLFCQIEPRWSLEISRRHSAAQLEACCKAAPDAVIKHCVDRVSPEQIDFCIRKCPAVALLHIPQLLTADQVVDCAQKCRPWLNKFLRNSTNTPLPTINTLFNVINRLGPTTADSLKKHMAKLI